MRQDTPKAKPDKPRPDFPLFPHANGHWAKKVRGKLHYFGPWADPEGALARWDADKGDLLEGRTPARATEEGLTIRKLANHYLTAKKHRVDTGEVSPRTFAEYHANCKLVGDAFGLNRLVSDLTSADFEALRHRIGKTKGPVALKNEVQRVRSIFKFAFDQGLIQSPVRWGQGFKGPSKNVLRRLKAAQGEREFDAADIKAMLAKAGQPMKAMILLGINCGFGNNDCAKLPLKAINLETGWVNFPRPKTGVRRRCPLWPETVAAVREALAERPAPNHEEDAKLVFITRWGASWEMVDSDSPVSKEMRKLLKKVGITTKGVSFYALRHTFATQGGESRDQPAVDHIMGHSVEDMPSNYRHGISDERLRAVTNTVRAWLFGGPAKPAAAPEVTDDLGTWLPDKKKDKKRVR